ncbi:hypothetical protein [Clostridium sp. HMP27]|uniref:hypothetical protein n=1 Tax=Clostridium sp. HMP27 TaxID=1487921 RepID=UPI00052D4554|nr:hypothetical protein [Clostridium sp. HMP27]KGK81146.1 hypothetical protein DP68_18535 [Clostridium sp. HMP27]
MEIVNNQRFITNSQIEEVINLLGQEYRPARIVVFENGFDAFKYQIKRCLHITEYEVKGMPELQNGQSVKLMILADTLKIFLNYKKDADNKEEKQADMIYDLVVELRRRYCLGEKMKERQEERIEVSDIVKVYRELVNEPHESLIYEFASNFMNQNADWLSVIMNWKEKWIFE